jgi:hypothetical protein
MSDSDFDLEFDDDETNEQLLVEEAHLKQQRDSIEKEEELALLYHQRRLDSIQHSSQRYLHYKRLDEMTLFAMNLIKTQLKLNNVEIVSMMGGFELGIDIKLEELVKFAPNSTLIRRKRPVLRIEWENPRLSLGVTLSGYVTILGARVTSEMYLVARRLACLVRKNVNPNAKVTKFKISNTVMLMGWPESIDLILMEKCMRRLGFDANRPAGFTCVQTKFTNDMLGNVESVVNQGYFEEELNLEQNSNNFGQNNTNNFNFVHNGGGISSKTTIDTLTGKIVESKHDLLNAAIAGGNNNNRDYNNNNQNNQNNNPNYFPNNSQNLQQNTSPNSSQIPSNLPQQPPPGRKNLHYGPISYPRDCDLTHNVKMFGTGSVIVMGLKTCGMGLLAVQLWAELLKKFNIKQQYTTAQRFGQFKSREININQIENNSNDNNIRSGVGDGVNDNGKRPRNW